MKPEFNNYVFKDAVRKVERALAHYHPRHKRSDAIRKEANRAGHLAVAEWNRQQIATA